MRKLISCGAAALWLAACTPPQTDKQLTNPAESRPVKELVMDGLKSPWSIAFLSDDEALVSEKEGGLIRINLKAKSKVTILGFPDDLANSPDGVSKRAGNNGIFDVVLDPDFPSNQRIYLAYSAAKGTAFTTKVIRGVLTENTLTNIETLFIAEPFTENERYHYGGGMIFGADGKLYITIGERLFTEADQPDIPIAQNLSDRRGKIYRLNADGSIPQDNPDFGPDAVPGIFAVGIRAAQGLTLNRATQEIWFSEHGTHQGDEINKLVKGANYGWPVKTTGKYRFADYSPPKMEGTEFTDPEWYWRHTVAPTGLTFYDGDEFPMWQGDLIVPGLSRGSLWRVNFDEGDIISLEELFVNDRVRSRKVAQSPNGTLYMLTDTQFTIIPGVGLIDNGGPQGQLIRIRNAAVD